MGGVKLLESAHVKDMLSMLRVVANPQDDIAWMRFLTLWNGVGDVGASKLAHELIQLSDIDMRCERLEQHGRVALKAILMMKQLDVLQHEVEVCISLAVEALSEQLEDNYKTKNGPDV